MERESIAGRKQVEIKMGFLKLQHRDCTFPTASTLPSFGAVAQQGGMTLDLRRLQHDGNTAGRACGWAMLSETGTKLAPTSGKQQAR